MSVPLFLLMLSRLLRVLLSLTLVLSSISGAIAGVHLTLIESGRSSIQDASRVSQGACHGSDSAKKAPLVGPADDESSKPDCVTLCLMICVQQNHAISSTQINFPGPPLPDDLDMGASDEPASSTLPPPLRPPIA